MVERTFTWIKIFYKIKFKFFLLNDMIRSSTRLTFLLRMPRLKVQEQILISRNKLNHSLVIFKLRFILSYSTRAIKFDNHFITYKIKISLR